MTQEIKTEALEQILLDIQFGFENEQQIFDGILDMFYDEENFDKDWLKNEIAVNYAKHQAESLSWTHPTDFERLAKVFDELIVEKIACLHKAGQTKSDGEDDCMEVIGQLNGKGIKMLGFCYYHSQDLARTVDPGIRNLFLGFDSPTQNDEEALIVAKTIVDKLTLNGFEVSWPGTIAQRIEIKNIDWKKIPDNQPWNGERILQLLSKSSIKKPFWKFW